MNKRITVNVNNKKFHFQNDFVWREGFSLYLTMEEAINGICMSDGSMTQAECAKYASDYKIAVEKYKKLKVFM